MEMQWTVMHKTDVLWLHIEYKMYLIFNLRPVNIVYKIYRFWKYNKIYHLIYGALFGKFTEKSWDTNHFNKLHVIIKSQQLLNTNVWDRQYTGNYDMQETTVYL